PTWGAGDPRVTSILSADRGRGPLPRAGPAWAVQERRHRARRGWLLRPRDRRHHGPPRSGDGATLHPRAVRNYRLPQTAVEKGGLAAEAETGKVIALHVMGKPANPIAEAA